MNVSGEKTTAPLSPHEDGNGNESLQSRQVFRDATDGSGSAVEDDGDAVNDTVEIPNGGLEAWLNVVAGFCVFVNSWYIDDPQKIWDLQDVS